MFCTMLKAKLHMATVTDAVLDYEGSIGIDSSLMDAVGILPYEKVLVSNLNNTNRFETYVIPEPAGSGAIRLNGPAALLGAPGDRIVVFAFCSLDAAEVVGHRPLILLLDKTNKPIGPARRG